jgi:hypothetical protein
MRFASGLLRVLSVASILVLLQGCQARVFHWTKRPLTDNYHSTPVFQNDADHLAKGHSVELQYRNVTVQFASWAIGDVAKRAGFKTVHYADLEILSILGIYTQRTIHVYGVLEDGNATKTEVEVNG